MPIGSGFRTRTYDQIANRRLRRNRYGVPFHLLPKGPPPPLPHDHFIYEYHRRCMSGYYTDLDNNTADATEANFWDNKDPALKRNHWDSMHDDSDTVIPPPPAPPPLPVFTPAETIPTPGIYYNHCCFYIQPQETNAAKVLESTSCQTEAIYTEIIAAKVFETISCQTDATYHSETTEITAAKVVETISCQTDAFYHSDDIFH